MSHHDPRIPWLKLAAANWIGETVKAELIKEFKTPEAVFAASAERLATVKGWTPAALKRFCQARDSLAPIYPPEKLDEKGIQIVVFNDPCYPPLLRHIPDSPIVLFAKGNLEEDPRPCISIVGARNGSQMGFDIARQFARELAEAGFVIVSGLALGIDTYAHLGALDADEKTIAVLGCGVDVCYPAANRRIRENILKKGVLISEFPPGTPARPWHFPIRNRIISGISLATLVIEATPQSGSLITARLAAEQNREVFAVPGPIRSNLAKGTLNLIKDGAEMVTSPQEIIDHFSQYLLQKTKKMQKPDIELTPTESQLLTYLQNEPVHIDFLLEKGPWKKEELFSMLLTLELRDVVVKYPGNFFQAKK